MIKWLETSNEVYAVIRARHHKEMTVHGTITDLELPDYNKHIMTEWGLPGADEPLIKVEQRHEETKFYIAIFVRDEE